MEKSGYSKSARIRAAPDAIDDEPEDPSDSEEPEPSPVPKPQPQPRRTVFEAMPSDKDSTSSDHKESKGSTPESSGSTHMHLS